MRILVGTLIGIDTRSAVRHPHKDLIRIILRIPARAVRHSGKDSNRDSNRDRHKERCEASP